MYIGQLCLHIVPVRFLQFHIRTNICMYVHMCVHTYQKICETVRRYTYV